MPYEKQQKISSAAFSFYSAVTEPFSAEGSMLSASDTICETFSEAFSGMLSVVLSAEEASEVLVLEVVVVPLSFLPHPVMTNEKRSTAARIRPKDFFILISAPVF